MFERLITLGTFDIPHMGHAAFLLKCEEIANTVTVAVNSDAFVTGYKGSKPLYSEAERVAAIRSLGFPDVRINRDSGRYLILTGNYDVIAIGTDWLTKDYLKQINVTEKFLRSRGVSVAFLPYSDFISTTDIRRRVIANGD